MMSGTSEWRFDLQDPHFEGLFRYKNYMTKPTIQKHLFTDVARKAISNAMIAAAVEYSNKIEVSHLKMVKDGFKAPKLPPGAIWNKLPISEELFDLLANLVPTKNEAGNQFITGEQVLSLV
jgi:hypothetical protein